MSILGGLLLALAFAPQASAREFLCFMGGQSVSPAGCDAFQLPANAAPRVIVEVTGAAGGSSAAIGAPGATAVGRIDIVPGGWLQLVIGTMGTDLSLGKNGGGAGGGLDPQNGTGIALGYSGGGYSEVRVDPNGDAGGNCAKAKTCPKANAVIIGAGGGGMSSTGQPGGAGGIPVGTSATGTLGGKGATASAGGAAGTPSGNTVRAPAPGTAYQGGTAGRSNQCGGGGGGGGRYGGGGGAGGGNNTCGAGGGGSSMAPIGNAWFTHKPYKTNPFSGGNGFIVIHYGFDAVTQASASKSTLTVGQTVVSNAVVQGDPTKPAPTGDIKFLVCGPLAPGESGCPVLGEPLEPNPTLTPIGNTKNSSASSPAFAPKSAGAYCFRAYYRGESPADQNILGYGASIDADGDQCFTVTKAVSSTALSAPPASMQLGQTVSPTATVTSAVPPTGSVEFRLCGPVQAATACAASATKQTVALANGTATAQAFTPTSPGMWCLGASYSGDNGSQGSTAPGTSCFEVTKAASTTSVTPQKSSLVLGETTTASVNVTGNNTGGVPGGDASFHFCGPLEAAAPCSAGGAAGGTTALVNGTAASAQFAPTAAGVWCVRGEYGGSANYLASSDAGQADCFTVEKATPALDSSPGKASIVLGETNGISSSVTGNATGGIPTGKLSFSLCGPGATECELGGTLIGEVPASAAGEAASGAFTPPAPGAFCVRTDYAGDADYKAVSHGSACFAVTKAPVTGAVSPGTATSALGQDNHARFIVSGNAVGGAPTGEVAFFACGPVAQAASCDDAAARSIGTAPLTAGPDATASAQSPAFRPEKQGIHCLRAVYAGDGDYLGLTGAGSGACFTVTAASVQPVATPTPTPTPQPPGGGTFSVTRKAFTLDQLTGAVGVELAAPAAGTVEVVARVRRGRSSFVFGRKTLKVAEPGAVDLRVKPTRRGARALRTARRAKRALVLRITVTFTPTGGKPAVRRTRLRIR